MTTMQSSRHNQRVFDRYSHVIEAAVNAWPSVIAVDPAPLLAASFKQPCRDAIASLVNGKAKSGTLAMSHHILSKLVVGEDNGTILVGSALAVRNRQAPKTIAFAAPQGPQQASTVEYVVHPDAVTVVANLLNSSMIRPTPVLVTYNPSTVVQTKVATESPNVTLLACEDTPGKYQII